MRIVLVSLYDINNFAVRILKTVLSQNGYDVDIVTYKIAYDAHNSQEMTPKERVTLIDKIHSFKPDIVGFTLRSMVFQDFQKLAPLINARVIVGGQHPTICPEEFEGYADTICIGDGEDVICDIVEGRNGIVYGGMAKDLNTIPSPIAWPEKRMSVITGRGCFFECAFCYNSLQKKVVKGWHPRRRRVGSVITEINNLKRTSPILDEIICSDNVFTWDYDWLSDFCREFKKTGLKFRCFGHFLLLDPKILELLKSAGCHIITAGIQGSERMRKMYFNRHESDKEILEGCRAIHSLGLLGRYDILRNIPYETEEDRESVERLISRIPRPFIIREFNLLNNPKTELTNRLLKDGFITKGEIQGYCKKSYRTNARYTYYE